MARGLWCFRKVVLESFPGQSGRMQEQHGREGSALMGPVRPWPWHLAQVLPGGRSSGCRVKAVGPRSSPFPARPSPPALGVSVFPPLLPNHGLCFVVRAQCHWCPRQVLFLLGQGIPEIQLCSRPRVGDTWPPGSCSEFVFISTWGLGTCMPRSPSEGEREFRLRSSLPLVSVFFPGCLSPVRPRPAPAVLRG